jgi:hypothetical protein
MNGGGAQPREQIPSDSMKAPTIIMGPLHGNQSTCHYEQGAVLEAILCQSGHYLIDLTVGARP